MDQVLYVTVWAYLGIVLPKITLIQTGRKSTMFAFSFLVNMSLYIKGFQQQTNSEIRSQKERKRETFK